ncbi:hypothetical protein HDU93_005932, partial [Gonapodya sp. JEL0774]
VIPLIGVPLAIVAASSWMLLAKADMAMLRAIYPDEMAHRVNRFPDPFPTPRIKHDNIVLATIELFKQTWLTPEAWKALGWLGICKVGLTGDIGIASLNFSLACTALLLFLPAMACFLAGPVFELLRWCGKIEYLGAWYGMGIENRGVPLTDGDTQTAAV